MMNAEERRTQLSDDAFHEDRAWSEYDLMEVIRREVRQQIDEREREALRGMGMMTIEGRVEFTHVQGDDIQARVDYTNLAHFLKSHFNDGDRIRLLVTSSEPEEEQ